ncbi:MAG: sigma-54 dependent transcriptional regulator [Halieaceae bacterium]
MTQSIQVLVIEDDNALREVIGETLQYGGHDCISAACADEALQILKTQRVNLILSDIQMPGMSGAEFLQESKRLWPEIPVVLMTAFGEVEQAVTAMRQGAADYINKPFEAEVLLETVARLASSSADLTLPVFEDASSHSTAELALRVAQTDASIVISGESGVGKEVFARLIHDHSLRSEQAFVAINCAAIPENMLESILFGFEKGAFTGAYAARAGKFEQANGGTLLLDEISEMELPLQAKLLRVLQEREVERLGGKSPIPLDVRILATTNRDLAAQVAAGNFREDLFYRLNVFPLQVPPLRERRADILPMCHRFIQEMAPGEGVVLDSFAEQLLLNYDWPGNVRELHNVVQRALILKNGLTVSESSILFESVMPNTAAASSSAVEADVQLDELDEAHLADDLKSREMELIIQTLSAEKGSRKDTAAKLGISPRTLRYKLARFREQGIAIPGMAGI